LVLARHGQTEWSRSGRHTGRSDIPLDDTGRDQGRLLGAALGRFTPVRVLVSPLQRAQQTCALAGLGQARTVPELAEWDYGDYEGMTSAEILERRPGWSLWRDGCPGGEDAAAVGRRADAVLTSLEDVSGDVVLIAHGHLLRVLAARWIGQSPAGGAWLALDPATISILGHERGTRVIGLWNDGDHLLSPLPSGTREPPRSLPG
jgi:probable phosphoglycerate mutase